MDKNITIGELAKLANVSVRTLQYYDRIELLKPSTFSVGGRRLYHPNDITILHQIMTLKTLGLSLKDIKRKLMPIESTEDILHMLSQQATIIEEQISRSKRILSSIHMIKNQITSTDKVDWSKYSKMLKLINDNNEYYWVVNYLEKDILTRITKTHEKTPEEALPIDWLKKCLEKAVELEGKGVSPMSVEAQKIAIEWWEIIQKYTGGDIELINQLYKFYSSAEMWPSELSKIQKQAQQYFEKTIEYFLKQNNINFE